jgi:hypothetical protein
MIFCTFKAELCDTRLHDTPKKSGQEPLESNGPVVRADLQF